MSNWSPDVMEAARLLANGHDLSPDHEAALGRHFGDGLDQNEAAMVARGDVPPGRENAVMGRSGVGGDTFAPDSAAAMIDREMAQTSSTVSEKDIQMAEMHARLGNDVQAANVAGGAGQLDAATDRAQLQQAGADYMMNGRPGESVADYEQRVAQEKSASASQSGEKSGGMFANIFGGAMGLFALGHANDAISGRLSANDDTAARQEGQSLMAGGNVLAFNDFSANNPHARETGVQAALDEGVAASRSLPGQDRQQQVARETGGGMMRQLNA